MASPDRFSRFAAAVQRRAVGVRLLEGVAGGLAISAMVAGVLVAGLWLVGGSAMPIAALAGGMVAGVVLGVLWAWQRRPSRLGALIEADRQLKLDDLLSSALVAGEDPFGQAVRAMAERACQAVSPSQVVLNRLGVRAWGGIGLAWALVIVLGLLVGQADTHTGASATLSPAGGTGRRGEETQSPARHLPGRERGVDEPGRQVGETESSPGGGPAKATPGGGGESTAGSGTGSGTGKTGSAAVQTPGPGGTPGESPAGGEPAGGVGRGAPGTGEATAGVGGAVDRQAVPWRSDDWPAATGAALQAVHDGRVPDRYRDVIREYFKPE